MKRQDKETTDAERSAYAVKSGGIWKSIYNREDLRTGKTETSSGIPGICGGK